MSKLLVVVSIVAIVLGVTVVVASASGVLAVDNGVVMGLLIIAAGGANLVLARLTGSKNRRRP